MSHAIDIDCVRGYRIDTIERGGLFCYPNPHHHHHHHQVSNASNEKIEQMIDSLEHQNVHANHTASTCAPLCHYRSTLTSMDWFSRTKLPGERRRCRCRCWGWHIVRGRLHFLCCCCSWVLVLASIYHIDCCCCCCRMFGSGCQQRGIYQLIDADDSEDDGGVSPW